MVNHIFIYLKYELRDFKLNYINKKRSRFGGLNPKLGFNVQMTTFKENSIWYLSEGVEAEQRARAQGRNTVQTLLLASYCTGTVYFHVPQRRNEIILPGRLSRRMEGTPPFPGRFPANS